MGLIFLLQDYIPVDQEELRDYVKARLKVFYEEELDVPLVLFNEVLDHVLRIDRWASCHTAPHSPELLWGWRVGTDTHALLTTDLPKSHLSPPKPRDPFLYESRFSVPHVPAKQTSVSSS